MTATHEARGQIDFHLDHECEISAHGDPYQFFRAVCSCGWRGEMRDHAKECSVDIGAHLAEVAIEQGFRGGRG